MQSKALLKSYAESGMSAEAVFTAANEKLCESNEADMFVTAWMGFLNLKTGQLTFANAGHNPPVVRRAGGVEFIRSKPSLILGWMPGVSYRVEELQLNPGDEIYLYTDGITEQPNMSGVLYGEDRLIKILSDSAQHERPLLDAVLSDVRRHAAGAEQADDCTQLVLRYRG